MTIKQIIDQCIAVDVSLTLDESGGLKVHAVDRTSLSEELLGRLRTNKPEIIEWLRSVDKDQPDINFIPLQNENSPLILSYAQKRLWFVDQMDSGSAHYNMPSILDIRGEFDIRVAERCCQIIIGRHKTLKTLFKTDADGGVSHSYLDENNFSIVRLDYSGKSRVKQEKLLKVEADRDAQTPFSLNSDFMIRAIWFVRSETDSVLLLNMHHIASDGWSINIFASEFVSLYRALIQGASVNSASEFVPELTVQYSDYAHWQKNRVEANQLDDQISYWKQHLAGLPQLHSLPIAFERPAVQTFAGDVVVAHISDSVTKQLEKLSADESATLFMLLHSAYSLLLSRYSNCDDIVVGTPVANRSVSDVEPLIGLFVNTLVLRTDASKDISFREYLAHVKDVNLDAQANQDVPFELLVETLNPQRNTQHTPLVQLMFTMDNIHFPEIEIDDLRIQARKNLADIAKFDLTLFVSNSEQGIKLVFEYNTDLFNLPWIERFAKHYENLLVEIVSNPESSIRNLGYLGQDETSKIHKISNPVRNESPALNYSSIHQWFEEAVRAYPDKVAITHDGETYTYFQLDSHANQVAKYIRGNYFSKYEGSLPADSIVALLFDRGPNGIIGILATLKSGAAYLPLDISVPNSRGDFILEESDATYLLTDSAGMLKAAQLNFDSRKIVNIETTSSPYGDDDERFNFPVVCEPSDLAYVIYTSGTTGKPKGVMVEHRNILNLISAQTKAFEFGDDEKVLWFASYVFDASVESLFLTLCNGATLIVPTSEDILAVGEIRQLILANDVTHLHATPSYLTSLGASVKSDSIRRVISGGEPCSPSLVGIWQGKLINKYGPTETTVTSFQCLDYSAQESSLCIGFPIENTQSYILSSRMQLVPEGVVGELYIGGLGVTRGYINCEELTADRFVAHPFSEGTLYKTGDLVRRLENGTLDYIGRTDNQIKINGYRIELGDIEYHLNVLPEVKQSLVVKFQHENTVSLTAYIVADKKTLNLNLLEDKLIDNLPPYMIPSNIFVLESFPLTVNGKIDTKALPKPGINTLIEYIPPESKEERLLCSSVESLLGYEKVGLGDNFFSLGGHSLLVVRLRAELQAGGMNVQIRDVFSSSNLRFLAEKIRPFSEQELNIPENLIPTDAKSIAPKMLTLIDLTESEIDLICHQVPGGVENIQDIYPLVALQKGIHFHSLYGGDESDYVTPVIISLRDKSSLDAFLIAIESVITRHDAWRTCVVYQGLSQPAQVVLKQVKLSVENVELYIPDDPISSIENYINQSSQYVSLVDAPLFRLQVIHDINSDSLHTVIWQHHIISDHESLYLTLKEIGLHIVGEEKNLRPPQPYRNFVTYVLESKKSNSQIDFFRHKLSSFSEPSYPFGMHDIHTDTSSIKTLVHEFPEGLCSRVRDVCRLNNVNTASFFHLVWAKVVSLCSNKSDVVFGTVVSGRMQSNVSTDQVMGLCINTLPLRVRLDEGTVLENLNTIYQELTQLLDHETAELAEIQEVSGVPQEQPLLSCLFNYRRSSKTLSSVKDHGFCIEKAIERVNYPISCNLDDYGDSFAFEIQLDESLSLENFRDYLLYTTSELLSALESDSNRAMGDICIMPDQLLEVFHCSGEGVVRAEQLEFIHQAFEQQVNKTPDKTALVFSGRSMTYSEVNKRANQVAHYLRGISADAFKTDSIVGLCLGRSLEMIIGLLGILKSGAAYLPLDPSYPQERLLYMIENSAASAVLTQSVYGEIFSTLSVSAILLDDPAVRNTLSTCSTSNLPYYEDACSNSLAYVIYTSGSTGKPKGVMLEHDGAVNLAYQQCTAFDVDDGAKVLHFASLSFDAATSEWMMALLSGAELHICDEEQRLSIDKLERILVGQSITHATLPPVVLRSLPVHKKYHFRSLITAGEAIEQNVANAWAENYPTFNAYGPTETTVCTSIDKIQSGQPVTIGLPIGHLTMAVLNDQGVPLPPGVVGELYVAGRGLARGYIHNQNETDEKFLSLNVSGSKEQRWYKTGDLVRRLSSGKIEFVGRADGQIKIRGYRIELGEITQALTSMPEVDSAVTLVEDRNPDVLTAYFITASKVDSQDSLLNTVQSKLQHLLPSYMIPNRYVIVDDWPKTVNGKVDKNSLIVSSADSVEIQLELPETKMEKTLAELWSRILNVPIERVGRKSSFFELGGHSLLLVKLVSEIESSFSITINIRDIYELKVLMNIAEKLDFIHLQEKNTKKFDQLISDKSTSQKKKTRLVI